jgi:hypothetical protein
MGEWDRSTRECNLESLTPEVMQAVHKYREHYNSPLYKALSTITAESTFRCSKARTYRRGAILLLPGWAARIFPMMDYRKWDIIRGWTQTEFAAAA